jgi:hypothetical protein
MFAFFLFGIKFIPEKVLKKENLKDDEDNKYLDQDYNPDTPAPPGHISETFIIKTE